jgi:acyl carrier protein
VFCCVFPQQIVADLPQENGPLFNYFLDICSLQQILFRSSQKSASLLVWSLVKIPQKLKDYIDSNRISGLPITDLDEPLRLDSLAFVRLVAFLETDLGIQMENEVLVEENFATLRKLGELIASKSAAEPLKSSPELPSTDEMG